eukprot:gene2188-biopygen682
MPRPCRGAGEPPSVAFCSAGGVAAGALWSSQASAAVEISMLPPEPTKVAKFFEGSHLEELMDPELMKEEYAYDRGSIRDAAVHIRRFTLFW